MHSSTTIVLSVLRKRSAQCRATSKKKGKANRLCLNDRKTVGTPLGVYSIRSLRPFQISGK